MRSPAMSGDEGDICISVEVLAVGSARLTITVEDIEGNAQPMRLVEVVPQETSVRTRGRGRIQGTDGVAAV